MWIKNLKLGVRLALEFGAVLTLALGLGLFLLGRLAAMSSGWSEYEHVTAARATAATAGVKGLSNAVHHFKNYVLRGGDHAGKFEADLQALEQMIADYRAPGPLSADEEARLQAIAAGVASYRTAMATLVDLRARGGTPTELDRAVAGADKPIAAALDDLVALSQKNTVRMSARIAELLESSRTWGLALMVATALLGVVVTVLGTRAITRPLARAVAVARQVAAGDLTAAVVAGSSDELGQLLEALGEMNRGLGQTVRQVRQGSDAVAIASREIAQGNVELSQRTSEQAAGLEETASSMEELTATVKQNDANARLASEQAAAAAQVAGRGEAVVKQAVASMGNITESSKKIAEIIGVIDGVAFQTNILALNAAVEAARAGDHGRGFAVVAAEVRSLSQRTATSAREVKALIAESVAGVAAGARLVGEAGQAMVEVQTAISRVAELMSQITVASAEQSLGIDQVNQAVTQMDQATQKNAAMVETAAANAEQLDALASRLTQTVSVFRVEPDAGAAGDGSELGDTAALLEPAFDAAA